MPDSTLTYEQLRVLAEDTETTTTEYWARVMRDTYADRKTYLTNFSLFQRNRFAIELGVKAAVTVTLAVSLFFTAPVALLLGGAALTLAMSSLIYSYINLKPYQFSVPENKEAVTPDFNAGVWEDYRAKWISESNNARYSDKQKTLVINMLRIGLALVMGFAAFAAIASGAAVPIALTSIAFAAALFYKGIDESAPYLENEADLPALAMAP